MGAKNTKMSKSSTKGASAVRGDQRFENVTVPDDVQRGNLCQLVVECGHMRAMSALMTLGHPWKVFNSFVAISVSGLLSGAFFAVRLNLVLSSSVVWMNVRSFLILM